MPDGHGCCTQATQHSTVHSAACRREGGGASHHGKRPVGLHAAHDLWASARSGSLSEVDAALAALKRNGGNVNVRSAFGVTALHLAVWRNHVPIIRHLLAAGADPNIRDGESGWSSLHRALHFGHLAAAGVLINAGASLTIEDSKGRTPLDLLSVAMREASSAPAASSDSWVTEVYSWGSGVNYQLGTGTAGIQRAPCRVDTLRGLSVSNVAAAKFHSAALTASGELYSWGFGRGGRLGHSEFHIHSGQTAVITPERVCSGLGSRRVVAVGTAKHHTIVATEGGEVYTWGSNREGRLGYPSVDTQPTPRRVSALRVKVVAVAAANKHSVVLTESGEVFTWGCNRQGQLGYGTSNSASNCVPRCVEFHASSKGKRIVVVAATAAKFHTIVLSAEGEVFTWGYKMVIPKRVVVARDTRKGGGIPLKFHRADKLHVSAIAAGVYHSTAVTRDGCAFYWPSNNPSCIRQILSLAGHEVVAVAAGKHRSAVATSMGAVYVWDAVTGDTVPHPVRIPGLRKAVDLSVGESHSVAISSLSLPTYSSTEHVEGRKGDPAEGSSQPENADSEIDFDFEDGTEEGLSLRKKMPTYDLCMEVASLRDLCQEVIAKTLVEPKNVLLMLELADSIGAQNLKHYCQMLVMKNLDYVLSISAPVWGQTRLSILAELQEALAEYTAASNQWLNRCIPKPTGVPLSSIVLDGDEDVRGCESSYDTGSRTGALVLSDRAVSYGPQRHGAGLGFLQQGDGMPSTISRQLRAVRRKLQQIEALEMQQAKGKVLDTQQLQKVASKGDLLALLGCLEAGLDPLVSGFKVGPAKILSPLRGIVNDPDEDTGFVAMTEQATKKHKHRSRRKGKSSSPVAVYSDGIESGTVETCHVHITNQQTDDKKSLNDDEVVRKLLFDDIGDTMPNVRGACYVDMDRAESDGGRLSYSPGDGAIGHADTSSLGAATGGGSPSMIVSSPVVSSTRSLKVLGFRKGGLSCFLRGELEAPPTCLPPPPPKPQPQGPAWGGLGLLNQLKGKSLRSIQIEQGKCKVDYLQAAQGVMVPPASSPSNAGSNMCGRKGGRGGGVLGGPGMKGAHMMQSASEVSNSAHHIALLDFLHKKSAPIAIRGANKKAGSTEGKKGASSDEMVFPWCRSPGETSAPSLRDIQEQQERSSMQRSQWEAPVWSPGGSCGTTSPGVSQLDPLPGNRWYRPEEEMPVSRIRNIQIEETAMKELRRKYSTVRLVTNVTR